MPILTMMRNINCIPIMHHNMLIIVSLYSTTLPIPSLVDMPCFSSLPPFLIFQQNGPKLRLKCFYEIIFLCKRFSRLAESTLYWHRPVFGCQLLFRHCWFIYSDLFSKKQNIFYYRYMSQPLSFTCNEFNYTLEEVRSSSSSSGSSSYCGNKKIGLVLVVVVKRRKLV